MTNLTRQRLIIFLVIGVIFLTGCSQKIKLIGGSINKTSETGIITGQIDSMKKVANLDSEKVIGGDRDQQGCLIAGGYAFDENVGACTRDFELTPDIKKAAKIAVDSVGRGYALTVVAFNSYEEVGAYDIMLERGAERNKQTVYIRKWQVTESPNNSRNRTVDILPADAQNPAAGICASSGNDAAVKVEINTDVPSPRCQRITATQALNVINKTDRTLSMWFGNNKQYSFKIPAKGSYEIPQRIGDLLEPGVHVLHGDPYVGPEIWVGELKPSEGRSLPTNGDRQGGSMGILPYKSGVQGTVTSGPTCPVQKNPPEPNCADKPYVTTVEIQRLGKTFATVETDKDGKYTISVPPGGYTVQAKAVGMYPKCLPQEVTIGPDEMKVIDLSCDTGLR